ncbi:hypothetical protein QFC20_005406 [Naganishia adeliensis]|uniref:Uncharacterized protein n=1 Tax=Naganishia adeliensis TaxID=92952 RepID=A0ACC2VNQ4_9TREE|nr:hypothetical protein QFC20_005406 [Naganishia adeliensis]
MADLFRQDPSTSSLNDQEHHHHDDQMSEMTLAAGMRAEHQEPLSHHMTAEAIQSALVLDPSLHSAEDQPLAGPSTDYLSHHYPPMLQQAYGAPHQGYVTTHVEDNHHAEQAYGSASLPAFPSLGSSTLSMPIMNSVPDDSIIPPPPQIDSNDLDTLVARINFHGAEHGYAVRKCQSRYKEGPNGMKVCERTYLVCDKSGKHRDTHAYMDVEKGGEGRKRRTKDGTPLPAATKRINCPFKLYARAVDGVWKWEPRCINHNHGPSASAESRLHRKLNAMQTIQASQWLDEGVRPHLVLQRLQEMAEQRGEPCYVSVKEIYNLKRLLNAYRRKGRDHEQNIHEEHAVDGQLQMGMPEQQEMTLEQAHGGV